MNTTIQKQPEIRVLVIEPGQAPVVRVICNELKAMQRDAQCLPSH